MIPINIAITGHRALALNEINRYRKAISDIIIKIKLQYANSSINLLTGMAEGADIIAAEEALKQGLNIIAVLPFKADEFIKTFNDKYYEEPFYSLIDKADKIIDLSELYPEAKGDNRYTKLGEYLVCKSQILIAVWDGNYNNKLGGTGDVVQMAINGVIEVEDSNHLIMDSYEKIPVYHIEVEDSKKRDVGLDCLIDSSQKDYKVLYPCGFSCVKEASKYYASRLGRLDEYNKDAKNVINKDTEQKEGFFLDTENRECHPQINSMIEEFSIADSLAIRYQKKTISRLKLVLFCGLLVFFWVTLFDEILPQLVNLLLMVPIFFGLSYVIYKQTLKRKVEAKYYEYRALAESLRVQIIWKLSNIEENAYNNYPRKYKSNLGWIISATSNISIGTKCASEETKMNNQSLLFFNKWVNNQLQFYQNRYIKTKKLLSKQRVSVVILFLLSMLFVVFMYLNQALFNFQDIMLSSSWIISFKSICLFSIDILLAIGAILTGYSEKRQYDSQNSQYIRMINIFRQGTEEYNKAIDEDNVENIKKLIKEIGIEAICENADWLTYNSSNTIDLPIGM